MLDAAWNRISNAIASLWDAIGKRPTVDTGVVTAVNSSPSTVTLQLNGSTTNSAPAHYLDSYLSPAVNDVVRVLVVGTDYLVLGRQKP